MALFEEHNRMSLANLAMVFGPSILRCEDDTPGDALVLLIFPSLPLIVHAPLSLFVSATENQYHGGCHVVAY